MSPAVREDTPKRRQLRHRLMLVWMLLSAFWLSGVSVWIADTRPAPGFAQVSSLLIGGWMMFAALMMGIYLRKRDRV